MRRKLIGGQSVESVEQFINEAVAQDETDAKTAPDKQPAETAKKVPTKDPSPTSVKKDQVAAQQSNGADASTPVVTVSRSGGSR
jgi:hypothetical protein